VSTEDQMSIEDRVRAATRAGAGLIREVRPLDAPAPVRLRRRPERGMRRTLGWGAPLAAAAAAVALALVLVAIRQPGPASPVVSHSATVAAPVGVPRYYASTQYDTPTQTYGPLIVGDDLTGKVIDTVNPPPGLVFTDVQGTSDDRTFVVMASANRLAPTPGWPPYTWYLLRIAPGSADPYQLTKLPIKLPSNSAMAIANALSPDGRELAVESESTDSDVLTLAVFSVSSGAELHTWTAPGDIATGFADHSLSWLSGGRQLVFSTSQFTTGSTYNLSLRTVDVTGTGTDLMAASRTLLSIDNTGASTCDSLQLTPDGRTAICTTQYDFLTDSGTGSNAGCANGGLEFTATSIPLRLTKARVLYQYRGACHNGVSYLLWTDASANSVIGLTEINVANEGGKQSGQVGVITDGHFRPLEIAKSLSDYGSLAF
jgi:hypothetical protein